MPAFTASAKSSSRPFSLKVVLPASVSYTHLNQYHDFDKFLEDSDLVVIMVNHNHIKENMDKLKGKIVFDTRKCCDLLGTYRL